MTIKQQLNEIRKAKGMTYQEVGDLAHVHKITVFRVLKQDYRTTLSVMEAIANALGYKLALEEVNNED